MAGPPPPMMSWSPQIQITHIKSMEISERKSSKMLPNLNHRIKNGVFVVSWCLFGLLFGSKRRGMVLLPAEFTLSFETPIPMWAPYGKSLSRRHICRVFMGNKIPHKYRKGTLLVHQIVPWLIVHHIFKLRVHGLNPLPRTLKSQVPWP